MNGSEDIIRCLFDRLFCSEVSTANDFRSFFLGKA